MKLNILSTGIVILLLSTRINAANHISQYTVDMRFDNTKLQMECKINPYSISDQGWIG